MGTLVERRLFNREEYHAMLRAGILKEDDPVELIAGEIVRHMPSGPAHASVVKRLNRLFTRLLGEQVVVSVQDPLGLDEYSEPEPDLMLLRPQGDCYADEHPTADDVWLVIEVAESSLASDTEVKLPLYAEHGVPEVWIVDLVNRQVVVSAEPAHGRYLDVRTFKPGDTIPLRAFAGVEIPVSEIGL
jgi:Uma2 family endonuclease